ncbi:hypothetical protein K438DRAFT_1859487 [Mycena galopus ATCC 62051]|nr:hypothetical protein K438DRAFT_1859487 [Mycena galopus ATCC 62051]
MPFCSTRRPYYNACGIFRLDNVVRQLMFTSCHSSRKECLRVALSMDRRGQWRTELFARNGNNNPVSESN